MEQRRRRGKRGELTARLREQRGMTLIELMLVVAIFMMMGSSMVMLADLSHQPEVSTGVRLKIEAAMGQATQTAASTGNGATLVFEKEFAGASAGGGIGGTGATKGPYAIKVYAGRPNGDAAFPMPTSPVRTIPLDEDVTGTGQNGIGGTPPFAVFIDGFGHSTFGRWSEAAGTIVIPTCTVVADPLTVTYAVAATTQSMRLACGQDEFRTYDSLGNLVPEPAR